MAVEEARMRLREQLEEMFGVHEAAILMDRPPGGWSDLATNRSLDALAGDTARRFDALAAETARRFDAVDRRFSEQDERFDLKLGALEHKILGTLEREFRAQTCRLVSAMAAFMGIFAAVVKL
jgi:hypothetical protein